MGAEALIAAGNEVYEAVRLLNHGTIARATPAPLVYDLTGSLWRASFGLQQLCEQLARGLVRSLDEFEVYDGKGDPEVSASAAAEHLDRAAVMALKLAEELNAAQAAISEQGHDGRRVSEQ